MLRCEDRCYFFVGYSFAIASHIINVVASLAYRFHLRTKAGLGFLFALFRLVLEFRGLEFRV